MKKTILFALVAVLVLGMLSGCKNDTTPALTNPNEVEAQYPPMYENYKSLFGTEMSIALAKLGYDPEKLEKSTIGYLLPSKVTYLGNVFNVYLIPCRDGEKELFCTVQYYMELGPTTGAAIIENIGENLQRMFGYQYKNGDIPGDGFRDFDVTALAHDLNSKEPWSTSLTWVLTQEVGDLPVLEPFDGITMTFRVVHNPVNGAYLTLDCQYTTVNDKDLVK
ncbi:MAG: hypothetical protein J6Q54_07465 [Oscillospiraceae bacterium]|nr:hypothetical protein [Oscillospiraceae bacterium]